MKNCKDTIGNRTRDLPACSAVPQTKKNNNNNNNNNAQQAKQISCIKPNITM
jgi:hypothetical protein